LLLTAQPSDSTFLAESQQSPTSSVSKISSILSQDRGNPSSDGILATVKSLLPLSALEREVPGSSLTLDNIHHSTLAQILNVAVYAIANNFPGPVNRAEIYQWLRGLGNYGPELIHLLQDSSNNALLQGLLRLAVEEGDISLARILLNAGADPNANSCECSRFPGHLRPLQHACLNGDVELAKELLKAGAQIDHPEYGWSCSPLLLAIYGFSNTIGHWRCVCFHDEEATIQALGGRSEDARNINQRKLQHAQCPSWRNTHEQQERLAGKLFILLQELLASGADINAAAVELDNTESSIEEWRIDASPDDEWFPVIFEQHSALTLAASLRHPELVEFLILHDAEVGFLIDGKRSALRECLYNREERYEDACRERDAARTLAERIDLWNMTNESAARVVSTATKLIMAGIDVNDHMKSCQPRFKFSELYNYSALDLGILTQDQNLINALWSAGANPTWVSFDIAIQARDYKTFCRLLESEAEFPRWAVTSDERLDLDDESDDNASDSCWNSEDDDIDSFESRNATDTQKRRATILAAIQLGACTDLETLISSFDCSSIFRNCRSMSTAIEQCCRNGAHDTLACLLRSCILPEDSLSSALGNSVAFALLYGHFQMAEMLLMAGADADASVRVREVIELDPQPPVYLQFETALQIAIRSKQRDLVQSLLVLGANIITPWGVNLLIEAILREDRDIVQILIGYASQDILDTASPELIEIEEDFEEGDSEYAWSSPLAAAIFTGQRVTVDQLLGLGASVNPACNVSYFHEQKPYKTCLWASVEQKLVGTTELLIQMGANVNDENAFKEAAGQDDDSVLLKLLVEKLSTGDGRRMQNVLHTALKSTLERGHLKNYRLILQSGLIDEDELSDSLFHALRSTVGAHRPEFLRSLIDAGSNPAAIEDCTWTHTIPGPHTTLLEAVIQQDPECVRIILETRARTNRELPLDTAASPLQVAAFNGKLEVVQMLLLDGQDPNVIASNPESYNWFNEGSSYAIGTSTQNATMLNQLDILKVLLRHGADPNATTKTCTHSALQIACRDGSLELVELLLEYGAKINQPPAEEFGATALQFAAIGGYLGIAHLLLEKGADVNAAPAQREGRTALEGAAEHGRMDMVQLLKNAGADLSESAGQFERALERARRNGHATADLLKSFLAL
jgi:ankyrin repeat protein